MRYLAIILSTIQSSVLIYIFVQDIFDGCCLLLIQDDATEAEIREALKKPIATWGSCHPGKLEEMDEVMRKDFELEEGIVEQFNLSKANMQWVRYKLGGVGGVSGAGGEGMGGFMMTEQYSGDMVLVPDGWLHMVTNEQDCVKVAYDTIRPEYVPVTLKAWKEVILKGRGQGVRVPMVADYMGIQAVLVEAVEYHYKAVMKRV